MSSFANNPRCGHCNDRYRDHDPDTLKCPDSNTNFKHKPRKNAASQSFSAAEVDVLARVLRGLPARADMRGEAKRPEFSSVARKVTAMSESIKRRRAMP